MHHMDVPMDYDVWGAMLKHCQTQTKADQHCRAKDCFLDDITE